MKKLYGDRLRKDGGLSKTVKNVVGKHARALESRAGKHAPEIKRAISEVKGTMTKVEERVTEAVEDFLQHARPKFTEVVQDTKFLLQQSRERMIITRVANDISAYDSSQYMMNIPSSSRQTSSSHRFHVGQPIRVFWNAPANHSRKDWIGIYRLGSCRSDLVTKVSSMGKWCPLYDEEWKGDQWVGDVVPKARPDVDAGVVVFDKDRLPWTPGQYEVRLHHDGKHNVMTKLAPIEIYVNKQGPNTDHRAVHDEVARIVALSVDLDVNLVPQSSLALTADIRADLAGSNPDSDSDPDSSIPGRSRSAFPAADDLQGQGIGARLSDTSSSSPAVSFQSHPDSDIDVDDFTLMDERQAKRIVSLLEMTFGVELATDVIVADANVEAIARRVLGALSLSRGSAADTHGD